jgi:hypothetical protein
VEFRYLFEKILLFASISSGTPRVVTATVAAFDVPPQGLSRNVKYGSSFGDGKSRGATGGLNSSEAWFGLYTWSESVRARNKSNPDCFIAS